MSAVFKILICCFVLRKGFIHHSSSLKFPKRAHFPLLSSEFLHHFLGPWAFTVGRVHLGPCGDQLLDHGAMVFLSRPMQRRLTSARRRGVDSLREGGRSPFHHHLAKVALQCQGKNMEKCQEHPRTAF